MTLWNDKEQTTATRSDASTAQLTICDCSDHCFCREMLIEGTLARDCCACGKREIKAL